MQGSLLSVPWRAKGAPEPAGSDNSFTDVSPSAYNSKAVLWSVEDGVTTGCSYGTFRPDNACTRGQIATFLNWDMKQQQNRYQKHKRRGVKPLLFF